MEEGKVEGLGGMFDKSGRLRGEGSVTKQLNDHAELYVLYCTSMLSL